MRRYSQRGVTLLELMIAVTIITILGAISVPNLLRARQSAYEASAAGFLHTVQTEQIAYRASHGSYATSFTQLPALLPSGSPSSATVPEASTGDVGAAGTTSSASGPGGATSVVIRNSYIFTLVHVNDEEWYCTGTPVLDRLYGQYLYTDSTGVIRSAKGAPAATSGYAQP